MKHIEIKKIIAHFKDKPVNSNVLREYCNLNHFELITQSMYEDYLFQQEHDERVQEALPFIFSELTKFQYIPTFISNDERRVMNEANADIEWKISKVLEDKDILYREIDLICKNLATAFQAIMENAGRRANNMCAVVLSTVAKEKFGDPLKLKNLALYYREKAKELGIKLNENKLSTEGA